MCMGLSMQCMGVMGLSMQCMGVMRLSMQCMGVMGLSMQCMGVMGLSMQCMGVMGLSMQCMGVMGLSMQCMGMCRYIITDHVIFQHHYQTTNTHIYMRVATCYLSFTDKHIYTCTHVHTCTHTHARTHTHAHTRTPHTHTHTHTTHASGTQETLHSNIHNSLHSHVQYIYYLSIVGVNLEDTSLPSPSTTYFTPLPPSPSPYRPVHLVQDLCT